MRMFRRGGGVVLVMAIGGSLLVAGSGTPTSAAPSGVATMSVGDRHTCAVRTDRTVWCWGGAEVGQVGDGTTGDTNGMRTAPVRVRRGSSSLTRVVKIAAGDSHTCAVRTDGSVWCWGQDARGQLGDGTTGGSAHLRSKAVRVRRGSGYLSGVAHVSAGDDHTCALRSSGSVYCWGDGAYGQLGDGTTGGSAHLRSKAVRVRQGHRYLGRVKAIAAGADHTCAVKRDGSTWCWGSGSYGQLGDGRWAGDHHRTTAVRVRRGSGYLTRAAGIAAGHSHTCVRRTDRTAWCWGQAGWGQLGDGGPSIGIRSKPVQVRRGSGVLTRVTGIGAGQSHTCARRSDGSGWCWGAALYGQMGDGGTGTPPDGWRLKPVRVMRPSGPFTRVRKLDGGVFHTCALRTDRSLWCWGADQYGQLGRGTYDLKVHPYPRKVIFA